MRIFKLLSILFLLSASVNCSKSPFQCPIFIGQTVEATIEYVKDNNLPYSFHTSINGKPTMVIGKGIWTVECRSENGIHVEQLYSTNKYENISWLIRDLNNQGEKITAYGDYTDCWVLIRNQGKIYAGLYKGLSYESTPYYVLTLQLGKPLY